MDTRGSGSIIPSTIILQSCGTTTEKQKQKWTHLLLDCEDPNDALFACDGHETSTAFGGRKLSGKFFGIWQNLQPFYLFVHGESLPKIATERIRVLPNKRRDKK